MSRSLSTTAKQAIFSQETDEVFLMLLTINHSDLASPIRVANNYENVISNGNTFIAYPFYFELPGEDGESLAQVDLVITNVGKLLVEGVRSIATPLDVKLQVVLASNPDVIEAGDFDMKMHNINYDALMLKGTCIFNDLLNEPYPAGTYTPADYPGLF
jgi:hypothetical protein